jgi:DMSO/TMAO reductase YedYZ heme-binding membrane subunit
MMEQDHAAHSAGSVENEKIVTKNRAWEWGISLLVFAALFMLMWEYHRWRAKPFSVFSANKAVAIATTLLCCLSLALGPFYRLTGKLPSLLRLRRPFGVTGVFFMCLHLVLAFFFVDRFDLEYYIAHWPAWVFGFVAFAGFLFLWHLSFAGALRRYGALRWRGYFRWAWVLVLLVVVHILFLGKMPNWVAWCETVDYPVPPGTTVPSLAVCLTLLLRLADRFSKRGRREGRS